VIYAYRQQDDAIELYASEAGKLPPSDYHICSLDTTKVSKWRLRDQLRLASLLTRDEP